MQGGEINKKQNDIKCFSNYSLGLVLTTVTLNSFLFSVELKSDARQGYLQREITLGRVNLALQINCYVLVSRISN